MGIYAKRYDLETFIGEMETFLKTQLAVEIAQMNVDRSDLTLDVPDTNAYYFQSINENETPYDPFVFYGEVNTFTRGQGPEQEKSFTIQVAILIGNKSEARGIMGKRLLRYRECLEEVFEKGWNNINKRVKVEVSGISPFPFSNSDTFNTHMGIGVTLDFKIV